MRHKVKLHLLFESYNYYYIKNTLLHLSKTILSWKLPVMDLKLIPLTQHKRKITLLKSPHVHKKAREQFELLKKCSCLEIKTTQKPALLILWLVNYSQFPGVEIKYRIKYHTALSCF